MNYSRAFTYVFEDKNWLSKILIAGLISLIPIIGQFYLMGWMIEIMRRVKAGRTDILPTTHFSYFLTLGLKLFVVALIYSIPLILVSLIINLINGTSSYDGSSVTIVYTSTGFFGGLISLLVHIAVAFLTTYGTIKLAETDQIKSCLDFKDAYNTIRDNLSYFIIVELLMLVSGIIGSFGTILCFIGLIFTMPYAAAINGHLMGQLWANLNTSPAPRKPFRGAADEKQEDIIQEAPFTRVEDIEKKANITVSEPVSDFAETAVYEAAAAAESAAEIAESAAEEAEEFITDAVEEAEKAADEFIQPETPSATDDEKTDDDIPSFE